MRKIAALVAATFCLLAFAPVASGTERWGWSELATASWQEAWTSLGQTRAAPHASHAIERLRPVTVMAVSVDPVAARVPGAVAAVLPMVDGALQSLRQAVAADRQLAAALAAHGYDAGEVVGASRLADGSVALLVGKSV